MPNIKSAKKRLRQSLEARTRNRAAKSVLRTLVRRVREAIAAADVAKSEEAFKVVQKRLDQTAAKGIIHRNRAARVKSRLSDAIKGLKQQGTAPAAPAAG